MDDEAPHPAGETDEPPDEAPTPERGRALHRAPDAAPDLPASGRRELAEDIESGGP